MRLVVCQLLHLLLFFSHSEGCLFTLFILSFAVKKTSKFNQVPLVYFCFYFHYSRRWDIEDLALIYLIECSMSSSKSFIVSGLTFRSLIHFELSLCVVLGSVLISFFYT